MVPTRIVIVEDHPLYRDALERGLASEARIVVLAVGTIGAAVGGIDGLRVRADVLLVDVSLPDGNGLELAAAVRDASLGRVRSVALTSHDDARTREAAKTSGCSAFVSKTVGLDRLVNVIEDIASGRDEFVVVGVVVAAHDESAGPSLSARELDCLALVAEGFSNRAIADSLGIGQETVKTVLGNVRSKLGARDRAHAVALAIERGQLKSGQ